MKRNDLAEIKKMDILSLQQRVGKEKNELASLAIDKNIGKLTNLKSIKNKRKNVAQILTVLKQKQLLQQLEEGTNAKD